jgi:hypothetical protein
MSNYCINKLTCTSGKPLGKVLKPYLTNDLKGLDFKKIVPIPDGIFKTMKRVIPLGEVINQPSSEEKQKSSQDALKLEQSNLQQFGYRNFDEWTWVNWGTCSDTSISWRLEETSDFAINTLSCLGFETLWSPPINVIRQLSKLTGESFRMSYYDEGWNYGGLFKVSSDEEFNEKYDGPLNCPQELRRELNAEDYFKNRVA